MRQAWLAGRCCRSRVPSGMALGVLALAAFISKLVPGPGQWTVPAPAPGISRSSSPALALLFISWRGKSGAGKEKEASMTEVTGGSALPGPDVAGEAIPRVCKRPGCGSPVPWSGRGRTRLFCGDACSRRFHNAARPATGGVAVSPEQAGDPLGALEALIGQAGSLIMLARGQAAALDPETVAVQLAEAEAARRRAEARAVTAEARAAEAEQEVLAALEAAEA